MYTILAGMFKIINVQESLYFIKFYRAESSFDEFVKLFQSIQLIYQLRDKSDKSGKSNKSSFKFCFIFDYIICNIAFSRIFDLQRIKRNLFGCEEEVEQILFLEIQDFNSSKFHISVQSIWYGINRNKSSELGEYLHKNLFDRFQVNDNFSTISNYTSNISSNQLLFYVPCGNQLNHYFGRDVCVNQKKQIYFTVMVSENINSNDLIILDQTLHYLNLSDQLNNLLPLFDFDMKFEEDCAYPFHVTKSYIFYQFYNSDSIISLDISDRSNQSNIEECVLNNFSDHLNSIYNNLYESHAGPILNHTDSIALNRNVVDYKQLSELKFFKFASDALCNSDEHNLIEILVVKKLMNMLNSGLNEEKYLFCTEGEFHECIKPMNNKSYSISNDKVCVYFTSHTNDEKQFNGTIVSPSKIFVFFHIFCNTETLKILEEMIHQIIFSGLYEYVNSIYCFLIGQINIIPNIRLFIQSCGSKFIIADEDWKDSSYERFTLLRIPKYINVMDKFLYIHTKGVTKSLQLSVIHWRQYMSFFLIGQFNKCLKYLNEYDTVGVNYTSVPRCHYSGNFWWCNASYFLKLPNSIDSSYWDPEFYIGLRGPRAKILYQSHVDHYNNTFYSNQYIDNIDKI